MGASLSPITLGTPLEPLFVSAYRDAIAQHRSPLIRSFVVTYDGQWKVTGGVQMFEGLRKGYSLPITADDDIALELNTLAIHIVYDIGMIAHQIETHTIIPKTQELLPPTDHPFFVGMLQGVIDGTMISDEQSLRGCVRVQRPDGFPALLHVITDVRGMNLMYSLMATVQWVNGDPPTPQSILRHVALMIRSLLVLLAQELTNDAH